MVLSIKDQRKQYNQLMKGYEEGKEAGLTIAKNQNKPDRVTPAQLKLIQDSRPVQSPYQPKEAIDPLDPAQGVVDKISMINPNTILLPVKPKQDGTGYPWDAPRGTSEEQEELNRRGWSISHGLWEDDSSNWADFSGGVQLPDGSWIYPTKDGKYIPESDEKGIERMKYQEHRQMYDRNQPHPDQNIAQVDYGKPTDLDKYSQKVGYPNRNQTDDERLKIMRGAPKTT